MSSRKEPYDGLCTQRLLKRSRCKLQNGRKTRKTKSAKTRAEAKQAKTCKRESQVFKLNKKAASRSRYFAQLEKGERRSFKLSNFIPRVSLTSSNPQQSHKTELPLAIRTAQMQERQQYFDELDNQARLFAKELASKPFEEFVDTLRERLLCWESSFAKRVLSHVPFDLLSLLGNSSAQLDPQAGDSNWQEYLTSDVLHSSLLRKQYYIKRAFMEKHNSSLTLLRPVFDHETGEACKELRKRHLTFEEKSHRLMVESRMQESLPATPSKQVLSSVATQRHFMRNLKIFTGNVIESLRWTGGFVLAGSALTACLLPLPKEMQQQPPPPASPSFAG